MRGTRRPSTRSSNAGCGRRWRPPRSGPAISCRPSGNLPSNFASTPIPSRASTPTSSARARSRRAAASVRSSAATAEKARPPEEHEKRLRAFVTRVLSEAGANGFSVEEVVKGLREAHKWRSWHPFVEPRNTHRATARRAMNVVAVAILLGAVATGGAGERLLTAIRSRSSSPR